MTIEIRVGDTWYEFPEGVSEEDAKQILLERIIKKPVVTASPPPPVRMDAGYYQRDDGTFFEITADGTVIEHGR